MKRKLVTIIIISFLVAFLPTPQAYEEWTIDGNTVYIDTPQVYASATPHTLSSSGWVEFSFNSKQFTGDVDFIWGFDQPGTSPSKPQIWCNYSHTLTATRYKEKLQTNQFNNISNYTALNINDFEVYGVDFGNANNTQLYHIYDQFGDYIIAFSSFNLEEETTTSLYDSTERYQYQKSYFDWKPFEQAFDILNYQYGGMNTWYLLKNTPITQGTEYTIRAWIDIPFNGLDQSTGKYWWAFKPSFETLQQSINNNHLYALDPWWDSDWDYMCVITIDTDFITTAVGPDIPVLLIIQPDIACECDGGDSIRFLSLDNTTEFNYEIEYWDDTCVYPSYVWVNISEQVIVSGDYQFLMYYGNAGASDNQDVPGTWNGDYRLVCHMNDTNASAVTDSTINANHGTKSGAGEPAIAIDGIAGYCQDGDGSDDYIDFGQGASIDMENVGSTLEVWIKDSWPGANEIICGDSRSNKAIGLYVFTGSGIELIVGTDASPRQIMNELYSNTTWNHIVITYDSSGVTNPTGYLNGNILSEDANNNWGWVGDDFYAFKRPTGSQFGGNIDELRIHNTEYNESEVLFHYHSGNNTTGFITFSCGYVEPGPEVYIPIINNMTPSDENTSICPCIARYCFNVSQNQSLGINISVYFSEYPTWGFHGISSGSFQNVSGDVYCFCMNDYNDIHVVGHNHTNGQGGGAGVAAADTWYNLTYEHIYNDGFNTSDENFTILYDGHYTIDYWAAVTDSSANPVGNLMAVALFCNEDEIGASNRECSFAFKQDQKHLAGQIHTEFLKGDNISLRYIGDNVNQEVYANNTWSTDNIAAYISIEKTDSLIMQFDTTYYWYINVTVSDHPTVYNQSSTYSFTTMANASNCDISFTDTDTHIISDETWVLPVAVIFAIGYFMIMTKKIRRKEK